jgi:hypothetical protein
MSVKPVDLQVLIPRTQELSRVQQLEQQSGQNQQQQFAAQLQQSAARQEQSVKQAVAADKGKVEERQHSSKQSRQEQGDKEEKEGHSQKPRPEPPVYPGLGGTIDIKI